MTNWYEMSIKELVEEFFKEKGYIINFDSSKFFFDEVKRWTENMTEEEKKEFKNIATGARNYAFNKKYGAYNYANDFRLECPNWNEKFMSVLLKYFENVEKFKILDVGGNNGLEMFQIFGDVSNVSFDIVDISEDAITTGRRLFSDYNFNCNSMDEFVPKQNYYDVYINLRAAYCAGNDLDIIVRKAFSSLKNNGIVIFSISNGYIDVSSGERLIKRGVYNPVTNLCSNEETNINLNWMKAAIKNNGFCEVEEYDIESEILLVSRKK